MGSKKSIIGQTQNNYQCYQGSYSQIASEQAGEAWSLGLVRDWGVIKEVWQEVIAAHTDPEVEIDRRDVLIPDAYSVRK